MLGKLHITAHSNNEKLQSVLDLTGEAIDMKIATDATSKAVMNKLHTTLHKAVGDSVSVKRSVNEETMTQGDLTTVDEDGAPEQTEVDGGSDSMILKEEVMAEAGDTMLEELPDEEDL